MLKMVTLPLVNVSGIVELFDRSIVTGCVVKLTDGVDRTTSEGDEASALGLISSAMKRTSKMH